MDETHASTGRVQSFALLGVGIIRSDLRASGSSLQKREDFAVRIGSGADAYASENTLLSLDLLYVIPPSHVEGLGELTLDYFSIRVVVQYRF